jgi:cytochrome c oxidase cbb3-type subunit 3
MSWLNRPPIGKAKRIETASRVPGFIGRCAATIAGFAFMFAMVCFGQQARTGATQEAARARNEGKRSFTRRCAPCHGLDGRGGEHAPGIVNASVAQPRTDEGLAATIRGGIPDKGMPSFGFLTDQQILEIVQYVHELRGAGSAANLKGDPSAGAKLYFGEAHCSDCHMLRGQGGFIASDLSEFGRTHSEKEIRQIIVQPDKEADLTRSQRVTVVTRTGQTFAGLVRSEDNFSIVLLGENGVFHLLMKSDIVRITREPRSIMPGDYGKRLSSRQLDDLASFLVLGAAYKGSQTKSVGAQHSE